MKTKILVSMLLVLSYNALNAMEKKNQDPDDLPFFLDESLENNIHYSQILNDDCKLVIIQEAELLANNYNKLSEYLYTSFESTEKNFITLDSYTLSDWILKQAREKGNVVCAYFIIRNYLRQLGCFTVVRTQEYKICLSMILFCLQRVAYDIVLYYKKTKDASVFNTYAIFKQKIHYLLQTYCKNVAYSDHCIENLESKTVWAGDIDFPTICKNSIQYWQDYQWYNVPYNTTWVSTFGWTRGWTPYSYGITFGVEPSTDNNEQQHSDPDYAALAIALNMFALVGIGKNNGILNIVYNELDGKPNTWAKFFESYSFPLTQKMLDDELKQAEKNPWAFD